MKIPRWEHSGRKSTRLAAIALFLLPQWMQIRAFRIMPCKERIYLELARAKNIRFSDRFHLDETLMEAMWKRNKARQAGRGAK